MINAQLDDQNCKILLKGIENKSKDLSKAMKTIAVDLRTSIEENFEVGGVRVAFEEEGVKIFDLGGVEKNLVAVFSALNPVFWRGAGVEDFDRRGE